MARPLNLLKPPEASGLSRLRGALVVAATVALVPVGAPASVRTTQRVEMSDGVGLSTTVILPFENGGPWPTILVRSPYVLDEAGPAGFQEGLEMAAGFGYAVVLQDTRGAGKSEGAAVPFMTDPADGHETLFWTLAQPWCDGRVLAAGASAVAIPAYLSAPGSAGGLDCAFLAIATPDVYDHAIFHGGVFRQSDVSTWTSWTGTGSYLDLMADHRDCDSWWDPVRQAGDAAGERVLAAGIHLGGWFDLFTEGTIAGFRSWRHSPDPWAANGQYLVLGPWTHFEIGQQAAGQLKWPANASFDLVSTAISYVQWCTDGYNDVIDAWPPVQYYVMGDPDDPAAPGNEWRYASDWPPVQTEDRALRLAPGGLLAPEPLAEEAAFTVPYDPANPSPTEGGRNLNLKGGPWDQAPVEARPDAVVFTTPALEAPLEVIGRVRVSLWVRTDGPDADVAVRLTDVFPDGRSMLVTDGIQRLSRRDGCAAAVPVTPGEAYPVEVDLWSTAWAFNTGHRIRIVVTGSNHPRFEKNPAVLAPLAITLLSGPDRESALRLPVPVANPPEADEVEAAEVADGAGAAEGTMDPDATAGDAFAEEAGPADDGGDAAPGAPDTGDDGPAGTDDGPALPDAADEVSADAGGTDLGMPDLGTAGDAPGEVPAADPGPGPDEGRDAGDETAGEIAATDATAPDVPVEGNGKRSSGGCGAGPAGTGGSAWVLLVAGLVLALARRVRNGAPSPR